jgi:hypothetical protein
MNPGAAEEGVKAAGTFMTIMKEQPLSLALIIMNLALLAFLWFGLKQQSDLRSHDLALYFTQQKESADLLARCIVPPRSP